MPRNVRNFWIDANIDGRQESLSGGPASKTGGFTLNIRMRDNGEVSHVVRIWGMANDEGEISLFVQNEKKGRERVLEFHTKR